MDFHFDQFPRSILPTLSFGLNELPFQETQSCLHKLTLNLRLLTAFGNWKTFRLFTAIGNQDLLCFLQIFAIQDGKPLNIHESTQKCN